MRIDKLTADFGKLNGDTLELKDGLNIICAPNESGKSTWCAFIRAMLYGVESSERVRAGYLPDKLRYAPWSGAPMQGTMQINAAGRDITLTRTTKSKNAPMREFSAVYTGTNTPVPSLEGTTAGETLTGVPREVFCRSAFIGQGAVAVSGSPELEKRIAGLVSTGEEDSSYTEADERLRAWQRKRKYNRRGRIPELETQIEEMESTLAAMDGSAAELERLERELSATDERIEALEQGVADGRKQYRRAALETLNRSRTELNARTGEYTAAAERARADEAALAHCPLGPGEPDEIADAAESDKARAGQLREKSEHRGSPVPAILLAALAIIAAVLGFLMWTYAFIGAGLCAVGAVLCAVSCKKTNAAARLADAERREILRQYGAADEVGIDAAVREYESLCAAAAASREAAKSASVRLEAATDRQQKLEAETLSDLDFSNGGTEAARLARELNSARGDRGRISARLEQLRGAMGTMGDTLVIKSRLETKRGELSDAQDELEAIMLAVETLAEADAEIQSRFSPELSRTAARYMSLMTGGRYDELSINRDFSAAAHETGASVSHAAEYLSAGTLDLMYLALRLAVCTLALPEGERAPLILDDTLVNFDDERTAQAMRLLRELARERQIVLFTCRELGVGI